MTLVTLQDGFSSRHTRKGCLTVNVLGLDFELTHLIETDVASGR